MRIRRDGSPLLVTCAVLLTIAGRGFAQDSKQEPPESSRPPQTDKRLLARWGFDQRGEAAVRPVDTAMDGWDVAVTGPIGSTQGIHGGGLQLTGQHAIRVTGVVPEGGLNQMTFSAWVRPDDLSGFREIFRQECSDRLLFSFQDNGSILSLGLNVGGYYECDARIDPIDVLDSRWHHCAGTFDGREMRVYLDGKMIRSVQRAGRITTRSGVPAFIGSSSGSGEFFQGALDDLRLYRAALSEEEVLGLYRAGFESMVARAKEIRARISGIYTPDQSLAQTISACRRGLAKQSAAERVGLAAAVQLRLRADFPQSYENLIRWCDVGATELLVSPDLNLPRRVAGHLLELAVEYKPLTAEQWSRQSAEQRVHWAEVEELEVAFRGLAADENGAADGNEAGPWAEWIDMILKLGPKIQWRPKTFEAVAPYVTPATPQTRDLTPHEAQQALRKDWLHQADGHPTSERIRREIQWTRQLAKRLANDYPQQVDFSDPLTRLNQLEKQIAEHESPNPEIYFAVRQIKRKVLLDNPVIDFDQVLLVDMPLPRGSEWPHETRHRLGYMAVPGGRLLLLEGLGPGGHLRQLAPQPPLHGSFWRPDLSYDAKKVLFCFKPHNEKSFHLYEVNLDGTGLVQLTDGPFDDLDPIYLPDERHLVFSTTRGHTYVRCMPPTNAFVLARCDRDGRNVYLISRNNEPDYLPSVMNDGRLIYTRWEYTDKPLWRAQSLWVVNPDGTQANTFWGNQSVWPDLLKDARGIPGSHRVMFTGSAHHNWFSGSVGIIDPAKGLNFPHGLTKVTADLDWPESGNGPVDPVESDKYHSSGRYEAYYAPYPLSERDFLVSANRNGKFVLYVMDIDGNRELIYEGTNNILHAQPVRTRVRPPRVVDQVSWPTRSQRLHPEDGVLYSTNVYHGAPPLLQGKAKYLRVLNIDPKTYTYWYKRPYISTGPVVSAVQSDGVKRILGTVPIESDGSVAFYAPAGKALHFQLLDQSYRALQTMRSFTGVMPGERRGCLGCHESHHTAPQPPAKPLALAREPSTIAPPPWGVDTVSYTRYVQPVLDRYCGQCHQGDGDARDTLDLTLRPGFGIFTEPYLTLIGMPTWGQPYTPPDKPKPGWGIADMIMVEAYDTVDPAAYHTPPPMTKLSYKSRLIDLCSSGQHYDVRVDPINLRRLVAWVDAMCPYRGREEVCQLPDPEFQGVDWLSVRPKIESAPEVVRPGPVD